MSLCLPRPTLPTPQTERRLRAMVRLRLRCVPYRRALQMAELPERTLYRWLEQSRDRGVLPWLTDAFGPERVHSGKPPERPDCCELCDGPMDDNARYCTEQAPRIGGGLTTLRWWLCSECASGGDNL